MSTRIEFKKIDEFIEKAPKPAYCLVNEEEWRNALLGAREALSNCDLDGYTTDTLWSAIFLSGTYFCKGMMWAETKAGLREETLYPRY
jgi:hypothetical protein